MNTNDQVNIPYSNWMSKDDDLNFFFLITAYAMQGHKAYNIF